MQYAEEGCRCLPLSVPAPLIVITNAVRDDTCAIHYLMIKFRTVCWVTILSLAVLQELLEGSLVSVGYPLYCRLEVKLGVMHDNRKGIVIRFPASRSFR